MFDASRILVGSDKRGYVKAVRRELGRHGWQALTHGFPGVDLFIRKLHVGHRLVICLRGWREVTPTRIVDIVEVRGASAAQVVCVFPDPIPASIHSILTERRLLVTTIDALERIDESL